MDLKKGEKTLLLIGANETNTDTLMLVHLGGTSQRGTIVSIPRDLYYRGRKLNRIYSLYGPEQLKKTMTEITGLPIQGYLYIDMFAFAEVVDVVGGLNVTLEKPLIDPTYVTKENGRWSTLYYKAGTHHLGGIETLRIARSRHSSDDFGRAARQQMILMALKDRIISLNTGMVIKAIELCEVLMNYVRTDYSIMQLFNIFMTHKDDSFDHHVLSWDNVLYHSYSNLYLLGEEVEIDENYDKGSWIMLPLNNDWNVIRRFIRNIIQGRR